MTFLEIPYLEQVLCTGRTAQVFPDTRSGTVEGKATYQLETALARRRRWPSASIRLRSFRCAGKRGGDVLHRQRLSGIQRALLEVEIPAEQQIELSLSYGGFPQEDVNMSTMQGGTEVSDEYTLR